MKKVDKIVKRLDLTDSGVNITYGGLGAINDMVIPELIWSVFAALLVMFALLLFQFANVKISILSLTMAVLCIFGTCLGLYIFDLDFSITALLGMVSLIGIIVRNAIIMYEYAESLRTEKHLVARDAAFNAGLRRMRPIFLTSATTALGVIPMIIAHTALWMPMGVVICFGTIFTLPLVVTVLPVIYWKVYQ
jgi:multidrug efflux pump subunit AcrB